MEKLAEKAAGHHILHLIYKSERHYLFFFSVVAMINSRVNTNVSLNRQHTSLLVLCSHLHRTEKSGNEEKHGGYMPFGFWKGQGSLS